MGDLVRIDRSQLPLDERVESLLEKDYGVGFGFVVCMFQKGEPMHPMGYVSPLSDGCLFVPTKHEHGHDLSEPDWDHNIFSLGCIGRADNPGLSPNEMMRTDPVPHFDSLKQGLMCDE